MAVALQIYGWVPEYYNDTNDLPADMPDKLKGFIRTRSPKEVSISLN